MGKKTKKEYELDFSFKYLQKRNIRKEKQEEHNHPHQLAIARWLGSIHHLRKPSPHTQSQSKTPSSGQSSMQTLFLRWLAIARPPQSFPNPKTRLLSGIIPNYKKRRHTRPHEIPTEESYPPYPPFLKAWQFPNLKNSTFHRRPCPPSHKRRRIDIKAQKRANGIIPHQLPHLDYKTRNKAATIKKRGITEHQTSMHTKVHAIPNVDA